MSKKMKAARKILMPGMVMLSLLASCAKQENSSCTVLLPRTEVLPVVGTKSVVNAGATSLTFGLSLREYDNTGTLQDPIFPEFANIKMIPSGGSYHYSYQGHDKNLVIKKNTEVSIYAYYPHVATMTDLTAVPFDLSGGKAGTDVMVAGPVHLDAGMTGGNSTVFTLEFHHLFTCLSLRFTMPRNMRVILSNFTLRNTDDEEVFHTGGTFDATDYAQPPVVDPSTRASSLSNTETVYLNSNGAAEGVYTLTTPIDLTFPEIDGFDPVTDLDKYEISFTLSGISYTRNLGVDIAPSDMPDFDLKRGQRYILNYNIADDLIFNSLSKNEDWSATGNTHDSFYEY